MHNGHGIQRKFGFPAANLVYTDGNIFIRCTVQRWGIILGIFMPLLGLSVAHAAAKAKVVQASSLRSTSISYRDGKHTRIDVIFCLGKSAGATKNVSSGILFTPLSVSIAKLKARHASKTKINSLVLKNKAGGKACTALQAMATPTPTASGSGNFDNQGNVTDRGRSAFGIPNGVEGNITSGRIIVSSYCTCHAERIGRSFPRLRTSLAQAPMYFDASQMPDSMVANITAYLNRFNP